MNDTLNLTQDEARYVLAGLRAFNAEARSDESHGAHSPEFRTLLNKVYTFVKDEEGKQY